MKFFGQYEDEIYAAGLHGVVPKLPIDIATLEKKAVAAWPDTVASYVQGGCGDEWTQDQNVAGFRKWGLVRRCDRSISGRSGKSAVTSRTVRSPREWTADSYRSPWIVHKRRSVADSPLDYLGACARLIKASMSPARVRHSRRSAVGSLSSES